jgi:hypothetical protein
LEDHIASIFKDENLAKKETSIYRLQAEPEVSEECIISIFMIEE